MWYKMALTAMNTSLNKVDLTYDPIAYTKKHFQHLMDYCNHKIVKAMVNPWDVIGKPVTFGKDQVIGQVKECYQEKHNGQDLLKVNIKFNRNFLRELEKLELDGSAVIYRELPITCAQCSSEIPIDKPSFKLPVIDYHHRELCQACFVMNGGNVDEYYKKQCEIKAKSSRWD